MAEGADMAGMEVEALHIELEKLVLDTEDDNVRYPHCVSVDHMLHITADFRDLSGSLIPD